MYPSYIDLDGGTKCRLYSNVMGECRHQTCSRINENDVKPVKNFLRILQHNSIKSSISIVNGLRSLTLCDIFLKFMRSKSFRSLGLDHFYQNDSLIIGSTTSSSEPHSQQLQVNCAFCKTNFGYHLISTGCNCAPVEPNP